MLQDVVIRGIGQHRGAPRLYLDMPEVDRADFKRGTVYKVHVDETAMKVTVVADEDGDRVVSGKEVRGGMQPVIDLSSRRVLGLFEGHAQVRVVFMAKRIFILPLASAVAQMERLKRLHGKLERGEALSVASIAHGGGVMSHATHAGAQDAGVVLHQAVVNEIDAELMGVSRANNSTWEGTTRGLNMPMQELVQDSWVMDKLPLVEVLEGGIPCSGASRAGITKRRLPVPEAHPEVGHLMAPTLMLIQKMQPAVVLIENVPTMAETGSAWILRSMLRDMGYATHEVVLDSHDFGALESRKRWFFVGLTNGLGLHLEGLKPLLEERTTLGEILDAVGDEDERWRTFDHLKKKAVRDREDGKGFKLQLVTTEATSVPTLRKGYHKGGSTDPLLRHPTNPDLLRLLTGDEVARAKQVPQELLNGRSNAEKIQLLGQGVAYNVVRALAKRIFEDVKASCAKSVKELRGAGQCGFALKGVA